MAANKQLLHQVLQPLLYRGWALVLGVFNAVLHSFALTLLIAATTHSHLLHFLLFVAATPNTKLTFCLPPYLLTALLSIADVFFFSFLGCRRNAPLYTTDQQAH